jgi:hypothetical protein
MGDEKRRLRTPTDDEKRRLERAKAQAVDYLFGIPGVHTVGIGYKRRGGSLTDELSVVVYVDHKLVRDKVAPKWLVPSEIRVQTEEGEEVIPTDVVERPRAVEYPHIPDGSLDDHVRPVPGGNSIEGSLGGGTLGGWVWDDVNDQVVLLSNRHVLGTAVGANVYQPWGTTAAANQIADNVRTGTLDATIAAPVGDGIVNFNIEGIGPAVFARTEAVLGMAVEKSGATTEHTTGTVVAVSLSLGHAGSTNDFEVDPDPGQDRFAYYGDSGSLIVEETPPDGGTVKRVVGLLWGGLPSAGNAYGHQINDVFADLGLTALCEGTVAEAFDSMFASQFARPSRELVGAGAREALRVAATVRPVRGLIQRPAHRGLAREVDQLIAQTARGKKLSELVHRNGVGLARLAIEPASRRVLEAAAAPFVQGLWSAKEVLERPMTEEDVERFKRALDVAVEQIPDLRELIDEAHSLLDSAAGRSFGDVLRGS